jgi:hypothetical protein
MGEHLAGAEAEVTYVEAFVLDRPVGRLILRLRSLCGSGEGEDKEEKAGTLQQEVLLGVCTMLRPRPHRRTTLRRRRAWWISVRSWLLVIVQIKRSSRRVQTRWRRRHKQVSVDVIRHITHRGGYVHYGLLISQVLTTQCGRAIGGHAVRRFEAVEGADLRRLLLSNSTYEGALRWVAGLQSGPANTDRMVRRVT